MRFHENQPDGVHCDRFNGRFVYLSDQPDIREKQRERREGITFPTDAQAVVILAQLIKHPGIGVSELAKRAASRGISIEPAAVQRLLQFHGL